MVKERKNAINQANIITLSSQVKFLTMKIRLIIREITKTEASTKVAVVTAKTAGPRSGTAPLDIESDRSMAAYRT